LQALGGKAPSRVGTGAYVVLRASTNFGALNAFVQTRRAEVLVPVAEVTVQAQRPAVARWRASVLSRLDQWQESGSLMPTKYQGFDCEG
jgi:hypothetical protein